MRHATGCNTRHGIILSVDSSSFISALDSAGHYITEPRRQIADLVAGQAGHFTAQDLLREAGQRRIGVGRATVFRVLELFAELELVERLDLPNGQHAYVVCQPAHHHHVVCGRCGRTAEVRDLGIGEALRAVEAQTGFTIESHRVEMFGLCPDCLAADRPEPGSRRPSTHTS